MRELWTEAIIPTGQTATIIGVWQDRPGGDIQYLCRYEAAGDRKDQWFNEHEIKDA